MEFKPEKIYIAKLLSEDGQKFVIRISTPLSLGQR